MPSHQAISVRRRFAGLAATLAVGALLAPSASAADVGPSTTASSPSADACPNAAVRAQQQAQALPDCRAWEQVSPARKFGYAVGNNETAALNLGVSKDGSRLTYDSTFPLPGSESGGWAGFMGERGATGWLTTGLLKFHGPNSTGTGSPAATDTLLRGSTPDQRTSVYWDCTTPPLGALWIRRADGTRQKIAEATAFELCLGKGSGQPWFLGISPDGRHVVFNSTSRLGEAAGLPGFGRILYEWVDDGASGGDGTLRVVNRTNSQSPELLSEGSASLGGTHPLAGSDATVDAQGARSGISDGSDGHTRIYFQNPAPSSYDAGGGPLFARVDGTETVEVSAPATGYVPTSPPSPTGIKYLDASRDGSRAYFFADGDLTPGAPPSGGIYRYGVDPDGSGLQGSTLEWIGQGESGVATTGVTSDNGDKLYYQNGLDDLRLVTASESKSIFRGAVGASTVNSDGTFQFIVGFRTGQCTSVGISPDGEFLAFVAGNTSTGTQVYRYAAGADSGAGRLDVVSSDPSVPDASWAAFTGFCNGGLGRLTEKRVMSDDGRTVFFDTSTALVFGDNNGPAAIDAYRWKDGEVALVSKGSGPQHSSFVGTDGSGANAFFVTSDALVPQDGDTVYDIYNARVGGGFAVSPSLDCEGDGCQGDGSGRSGLAGPGSSALRGAGNARAASRAGFSVARLTGAQRSALARRGRATLVVRVSRAGRVTVVGRARVGDRVRTVASASKRATRSGKVRLALRLSKAARRQLSSGGRLRLSLSTRFQGVDEPRTLSLSLRRSK